MEHVPVRLHDFTQEDTVVCNSCYVDGVGDRIPWIEIIGRSHHCCLLGAVATARK